MKRRATSLLLLLAIILAAGAARAHVDSLGEPDPYWQQATTAPRARADVAPSDASPNATDAVSRLRRGAVYMSGGVSLLLLVSLARSLRGSLRRTRA